MIILAFDTETSGLDFAKDRVVEFGAYAWDTEKSVEIFSEGMIFKIPFRMSDDVIKIHKITNRMMNEGVLFEEYANRAHAILSRADVILGHNIEFDINMMSAEFIRAGLTMPKTPWMDTLVVARRFYPSIKDVMPKKSLGAISGFFGMTGFDAHRAVDDCKRTMEVLFEICGDLDITPENILDPEFNMFGKYAIALGMDPFLATICGYMSSSVHGR
jgi:DNA polymerase-3 subunit alpha (Gram-positive type)